MSEVSQRHLAQLVLINAISGFNLVAIKLGVDRFPPVFVGFLRFLIVGLVAIKRVRDLNALELQAWLSWGSLPVFLMLSFWLEQGQIESLRNIDLTGAGAVL
jgi:drug/metabolite transporter (DMT)-like permease